MGTSDEAFAYSYWRDAPSDTGDAASIAYNRLSDEDFKLLADNVPTLCWIARGDGHILWYNRRWHDYCGSTPESMEGWGWQSVHDTDELPHVLERWKASIATGQPFEMLFPLRGADGVFRPFLTRIVPVRDRSGHVVRWLGVNTEIGAQIRAEAALKLSEARFAVLTEAMPQLVWVTDAQGKAEYFNEQWFHYTGLEHIELGDWENVRILHPDDQSDAYTRWAHSLATGEPYEVVYRLRHRSGAYRWVLARALPIPDVRGLPARWIGTCTDIHERKQMAAENELLARELSHRIKNIFAVILGLIGLTARRYPEVKKLADELQQRVGALGRAHDYARPHLDRLQRGASQLSLVGMLNDLLSPYLRVAEQTIEITGEEVPIGDYSATPLALAFHEFATNAAKYGAMSLPSGCLSIEIQLIDETVIIDWRESGGPTLSASPTWSGFGSRLAQISITEQLGGDVQYFWRPHGLQLRISVPYARLQPATNSVQAGF
jgi:PAS domain S-box-containing protein